MDDDDDVGQCGAWFCNDQGGERGLISSHWLGIHSFCRMSTLRFVWCRQHRGWSIGLWDLRRVISIFAVSEA